MDYITTPAQFEQFKKECEYWVKLLQLSDWEWRCDHIQYDGLAACYIN